MQEFINDYFGKENVLKIDQLAKAGSNRMYFRVHTNDKTYIVCESNNIAENESFFYFSQYFKSYEIPVPEIYKIDESRTIYVQQDFGKDSLLDLILKEGQTEVIKKVYKLSLSQLVKMQVVAGEQCDYSKCFASKQFNKQAVLADLNYFKYYFLDINEIAYDKILLLQEFEKIGDAIEDIEYQYFMFRDFQGRNIMVKDMQPYFIDYQGGMKGPLQYDVSSLLWQAKAQLSVEWKEELLTHYKIELRKQIDFDEQNFNTGYKTILLIRLLQVLGAYGLRGLIQKRSHFLTSIPQGLNNVKLFLNLYQLEAYPILDSILKQISEPTFIKKYQIMQANPESKLNIKVQSFSYKQGIPEDESGNGGGFVFDCRGILNPGRYEEYKKLTGRDQPVIEFLESKTRIHEFLDAVKQAVDISVEDYLARDFESLMISFGCTGGQHRSVYCADSIAKHLKEKYNVNLSVKHIVQEGKNWIN